ncbi:MAG: hypothetical protein B9S34_03005 [Opitutia bacterium Tous-C1TDCM]|nr:MAG: hypothetical protein B9S34_03005 [Opitutae bacterium Tous-C1TDCM]
MTATVRIYLALGDPASTRTAEISNWTGKAVAGPRSELDRVLAREEASKPGVYFLAGINPETGKDRVYIGEAESIRNRIRSHLDKEFWTSIIYFVSKDENLTKAHIKYLEGKLIDLAREAARFEVENTNSSGARLPESDAADMDVFLSRIVQLLPILGQDSLRPRAAIATEEKSSLLYCEIKGVRATGRLTSDGIVVFKDSLAVLEERPSTARYPQPSILRARLLDEGVLARTKDGFKFMRDYEFSSPSTAASVIHGGHANGLTAWKYSDGLSLKQKEAKELG